jgi:hypothetical protein
MRLRENIKFEEQPDLAAATGENAQTDRSEATGTVEDTMGNGQVAAVKKNRKGRKAVQEFLGGEYLSKERVTGNIPFFLYLALLAMIYISNTYSTERKFKDIERTKVQLKELRYHYITAKAELMFLGRQSEISKKATEIGLKESMHPPFKIMYSGDKLSGGQHDKGR